MRWKTMGLCLLSLGLMTGCSGAFGPHGRIGRAMRKDLQENYLGQHTCDQVAWEEVCESGRNLSDECIEECFE